MPIFPQFSHSRINRECWISQVFYIHENRRKEAKTCHLFPLSGRFSFLHLFRHEMVFRGSPRRPCYWMLLSAETLEIKMVPSSLVDVKLTGTPFPSLIHPQDVSLLVNSLVPDSSLQLGGKKIRYLTRQQLSGVAFEICMRGTTET